jgi:hypothetical protein
VNGKVVALAVHDTLIYIGGNFTSVGGLPRQSLAAISLATGAPTSWNPGADSWVGSLAAVDSTVYAGGIFGTIGGAARMQVAALDARTGLARPWNPAAIDPTGPILGACPTSVAAVGRFGPGRARPCENLAAIDLRTGEVLDWNPGTTGLAPSVLCMDLGGGRLYVGGWFDTVGGLLRPEVASIDIATGQVTDWRPVPDTEVGSVAVHDSTVYLGGAFNYVGGLPRHGIVAINARTGVPTDWHPDANAMVRAFAFRDSTVYCAGDFAVIGGQPRSSGAALSMSTGQPTAWNAGCNSEVDALVAGPTGVWLGGMFTNVGGQARNHIAQADLGSGAATPWTCALTGNAVHAITQSGSAVYIGGEFTSISGSTRANLAALDAASGLVLPWNPGPDKPVHALVSQGDTVIVGGEFTVAAGQPRGGLVRMLPAEFTSPAVTVLGPVGDVVLAIGSTRRLAWLATDAIAVQSVDIYLSRTGPAGPWTLLAAGAANTGGYDWVVSGPEANGTAWLLVVARNYAGHLGSAIGGSAFTIATNPLAVGEGQSTGLWLALPYPNPVRATVALSYSLSRAGRVRLGLFDVQGRVVRSMLDNMREAGRYSTSLDVGGIQPGLYFVRLQVPGTELRRRVVVVR